MIHYLTVPSNPTYGFEGVSQEEFEIWRRNVFYVLQKTSLKYLRMVRPGTDSSAYLWADADEFDFHIVSGPFGVEIEPKKADDCAISLSDSFWDILTSPEYDFFSPLEESKKEEISKKIQSWID